MAAISALSRATASLKKAQGVSDLVAACRTCIHDVRQSCDDEWAWTYGFGGLESAITDLAQDPEGVPFPRIRDSLVFVGGHCLKALQEGGSVISEPSAHLIHQLRDREDAPQSEKRAFARMQCLEVLAAGFFGVLNREWTKEEGGMPFFSFRKLWSFDPAHWGTDQKNVVLIGVLVYFDYCTRCGEEKLREQKLTFVRKSIPSFVEGSAQAAALGPVEFRKDFVSIHEREFVGPRFLQADFANEFLGGGVLGGGGSQEEAMFVRFPELLASIFLCEKMGPHEAVEIRGAVEVVSHNMHAWRETRDCQFCRPLADELVEGSEIVAVAFDAVPYGRRGHEQYRPQDVRRELRKVLAALYLPDDDDLPSQRTFVTGRWGCGAFRGDVELKFVIQWCAYAMDASTEAMVFCPFEDSEEFRDAAEKVVSKFEGKSAQQLLDKLLLPALASSRSTFCYLLDAAG